MTKEEFDQWVHFHGCTFPKWGEEVSKLPFRNLTIASWRVAMASISMKAALQASAEMLEGKHGKTPFETQGHVTLVASRAKEIDAVATRPTPKYAEDLRLKCAICCDKGVIVIVHPRCDESELCRAGAWCGCDIGRQRESEEASIRDKRSPNVSPEPVLIYDPDKHVRWQWNEEAMREQLIEIRSRGKDKANYETGFDTWNEGASE
jgi:hypothetical protein